MRKLTITISLCMICVLGYDIFTIALPENTFAASVKTAKKPAIVKWKSVRISSSKSVLKWKKAKNARKYEVYNRIKGAKWKKAKTLKKLTVKLSVKNGKTYQYKVRGVNGKKKGTFSKVKTLTVPKKAVDPGTGPDPGDDPVIEPQSKVIITSQPQDTEVKDGEEALFSVSASLTEQAEAEGDTLTYQWYRNRAGGNESGTKLSGADSPEYTFRSDMIYSGTYYFCIITTGSGEKVKTEAAKLTVTYGDKVYILSSSGDMDMTEGDTATFSVEAAGARELTYQWYISDSAGTSSGKPIKDACSSTYDTRAYLYNNNKYYYCIVSDGTSEGYSKPAKLTVTMSDEHKQAVADIKALITEHGTLTTNTVSIDGLDFYIIANENGKALLLAKQPSSYYEHSIADNDVWDCNYEGLTVDGDTPYYDEEGDPIEEEGHYGAIVEMNSDYLDKNPTIDMIATQTLYYTLFGEEYTMDISNYYTLKNKIFLLSQGDVTGMYAGENSGPYDYTFNMSQHWQHFGNPLPKEIVDMYVDGEIVPWFVRSPYASWTGIGSPGRVVPGAEYPQVEAVTDEDDVKSYARPAFWVDISD